MQAFRVLIRVGEVQGQRSPWRTLRSVPAPSAENHRSAWQDLKVHHDLRSALGYEIRSARPLWPREDFRFFKARDDR